MYVVIVVYAIGLYIYIVGFDDFMAKPLGPQACGTVLGLLLHYFTVSFRFIVSLLYKYCQGENKEVKVGERKRE